MTKYPIGLQNFQGLREDGYVYVDKTAFVHEMANSGKYYFLSARVASGRVCSFPPSKPITKARRNSSKA